MSEPIESNLAKIPIVNKLVVFAKKIRISGKNGFSLYDLLEMYVVGLIEGAFSNRATSIAFSFFMALFPFALFILNLIPYIPIEGFQEDFLQLVADNVPPKTYDAIAVIINDILNNSYQGLLSSGFLLSIFLMSNGLNAVISGFESSYYITIKRSFWRNYLISIGLSILLVGLLIVTVTAIILFEVVIYFLENQWHMVQHIPLLQTFRFFIGFALLLLATSFLYKFSCKQTRHISFISYGSVMTAILTVVSSYIFGIYVEKFSKYNELYGSIGTLLVFMFYIWINCTILLLGFELNLSVQKLKEERKMVSAPSEEN
jgi:membrane protein